MTACRHLATAARIKDPVACSGVFDWGNHRWRSSRNIRRLFRKRKISDDTWKYIDELKLHVFEMRYLPEETRKLFRSDMRIVVDFLAEGDGYRSDKKIVHKAALIKMIKVLSGEMDTEDVEKWMEEQEIREEDEVTVCELFDQYERRGMKRGIEKGENRFAMLAQMLMDSGRNDDLRRAISDRSYREQLYMEVKLS